MKSLFKKKLPSIIGLDIGTRQIKAVLLEQSSEGFILKGYACETIAKQAFAEREIKDFDAINLALKKVKHSLKTKIKDAAIAVAGTSVISKIVYMDPDQNDFELESQIEIEADSLIPYPLEEVYLDFEEIGPSPTHVGKVNVLLSAAHKDAVDSRLTLVREIPFDPKIVDVEGYALGNAIDYFYPQISEDERVVCVNVGSTLLQICVWENGQVIYSKEHQYGVSALIQDLSVIHMMEKEEAERQLLEKELPGNWIEDTLPIFAANLQQQINRALQMYMTTLNAQRPESLLLAGGAANISPLVELLKQDLGLDVDVFNPFANMQLSSKIDPAALESLAPQLTIAAGLASRSFNTWHI